jgi:hypothetical protein
VYYRKKRQEKTTEDTEITEEIKDFMPSVVRKNPREAPVTI